MIKEVHMASIGGISASKTRLKFIQTVAFNKKNILIVYILLFLTISLEMPVPSQGYYGFHSFPVVD
jgi:hypothetical protein